MSKKPFDEVFREFYKPLYNYVYMQLLCRQDAEDIVSETFTRAYRAYESYQPSIASEKTWLFRIAKNLLVDYYRRRAASPERQADDEELNAVPADGDEYAEIEEDTNRIVYLVLRQLRTEEREILLMRYVKDMKNPEIASELGISAKSVSERIRRALAKCRKLMDEL